MSQYHWGTVDNFERRRTANADEFENFLEAKEERLQQILTESAKEKNEKRYENYVIVQKYLFKILLLLQTKNKELFNNTNC